MTHSPLPWTKKAEFTKNWFLYDANGETIVLIAQTKLVPEPHPDPTVTLTRTVERPHANANAALFFAAPKLLAAAKHLLDRFDSEYLVREEMLHDLRDAVAEAETVS